MVLLFMINALPTSPITPNDPPENPHLNEPEKSEKDPVVPSSPVGLGENEYSKTPQASSPTPPNHHHMTTHTPATHFSKPPTAAHGKTENLQEDLEKKLKPEVASNEVPGSAAPKTDTVPSAMNSMPTLENTNSIPPAQPKKTKFSPKGILATVVLLLVVLGGGAGYYLTQMNQDIRQQAYPTNPCTPGQRVCEGNAVYTCTNSAGSYQHVTTCSASQVCRSGACVAGPNVTPTPPATPPPGGGIDQCYGVAARDCPNDPNRTCERQCLDDRSGGTYTSGACRGLTVDQCAALGNQNGWTVQYCSGQQQTSGPQEGEFTNCGGNSTNGCGQVDLLDGSGNVVGFVIDETNCGGGGDNPPSTPRPDDDTPPPTPPTTPPPAGRPISCERIAPYGRPAWNPETVEVGNRLTFGCVTPTAESTVSFRVIEPGGNIVSLGQNPGGILPPGPGVLAPSQPYTVRSPGSHTVQCRVCSGSECTAWEQVQSVQ